MKICGNPQTQANVIGNFILYDLICTSDHYDDYVDKRLCAKAQCERISFINYNLHLASCLSLGYIYKHDWHVWEKLVVRNFEVVSLSVAQLLQEWLSRAANHGFTTSRLSLSSQYQSITLSSKALHCLFLHNAKKKCY